MQLSGKASPTVVFIMAPPHIRFGPKGFLESMSRTCSKARGCRNVGPRVLYESLSIGKIPALPACSST